MVRHSGTGVEYIASLIKLQRNAIPALRDQSRAQSDSSLSTKPLSSRENRGSRRSFWDSHLAVTFPSIKAMGRGPNMRESLE